MKKGSLTFFLLLPIIISALLIAAHFLRTGNYIFLTISLLLPLILFIHQPLSARVIQGALVLATLEWIRTTFTFVSLRLKIGVPWTRLAIILGIVAVFTLASTLVFYSSTLRERYCLTKKS